MSANLDDHLRTVFFPFASGKIKQFQADGRDFVHYTSAEVALSIIDNGEMWMRAPSTMNDRAEISHGVDCLKFLRTTELWTSFLQIIDSVHQGSANFANDTLDRSLDICRDTYLMCLSEHLANHPDGRQYSEDRLGRLSMWRAYGGRNGVALVLRGPALFRNLRLGVFGSPVGYFDKDTFVGKFAEVLASFKNNTPVLSQLTQLDFNTRLEEMVRFALLCTKHPAFHEEREWRFFYSERHDQSSRIKVDAHCIRGTPQLVAHLPLKNDPLSGIDGIAPADLIKKIVIGPAEFPEATFDALARSLTKACGSNAADRISISGVPLRLS